MIIIGAGAAGMMAAIHASENYDVTIIEKNEKPGKKLFITGKGRCNVTNDSDRDTFLKNVVTNPKFLYSAINSYDQNAVIRDFESWGVNLKTERGNRVFPVTDHSSDIIKALEDQLKKRGVKVLYNTSVKRLIYEKLTADEKAADTDFARNENNSDANLEVADKNAAVKKTSIKKNNISDKCIYRVTGVELSKSNFEPKKAGQDSKKPSSKSERLYADVVVLATGGKSYPRTGSTGDGYRLIKPFNIDVEDPRPALVPIVLKEKDASEMMGLSLKNVSVKVTAHKSDFTSLKKDKVIYEDFGEMLFTHFGVSGPLCISASSYISKFLYDDVKKQLKTYEKNLEKMQKKAATTDSSYIVSDKTLNISAQPSDRPAFDYKSTNLELAVDLKPALTEEELDRRVLRDFQEFSNRDFQNSLGKLLPRLMVPVIVRRSGIRPDKKVNEITAEERLNLVQLLKNLKFTITGLRDFDEAIITGGGISVKEVNPQNMELKKVQSLRVAGELLDCDALTGGFNLQIAWCTAYMSAI